MSPKLSPSEARRQRDAFKRKANAIIKQNEKIFTSSRSQAFKHIRDLRSDVQLAIVGAKGFQLQHLKNIRTEIDAAGVRMAEKFNASMSTHQDDAWELGGKLATEGFAAAKIELALPMLPESLMIATKDYTADLITDMATQTISDVSGHLRRGIIMGDSPYKTMKRIEDVLLRKHKGTFWRAERIVRTENNRIFNMANHEREKQALEQIPDLMKQWVTGPVTGPEAPRPSHAAANGQIRKIDEPFDVGGEKLQYPGDLSGSPQNVCGCRCVSQPWRKEWEK